MLMTREKLLLVRLTDDEKARLAKFAKSKQVSMSEVIQDYCKQLPEVEEK
ncbi:CopG domain protein DNA-binding domain protein [Cyanobacterium stanieri PCC 7202]|uniref:CopG domain protein DNA-binding domain protein n=1 Tax=Cyanobacterium stanieri (strain ATCC 29140 / PCC 7202) TaxID=292563 RepID=K9YJA4_CYASC|nr:CopG domain protein DNA-binding domain protein [Cyanobacterium stanieri PCC 7202]AFZ46450.1 CopG domain protein DNA-binding domain protein [Cyanobacterium stanieri PCC 7202]AFZ47389.1 CopG domain protein DNA-binding domain protein [Cyanobacterium stanieri PCC 7202]AFZ47641.1 CopG domain protein DNA-binding domain protein [Cyanobacterium stanieri PCC 7202]